jgi:hypothetical protein
MPPLTCIDLEMSIVSSNPWISITDERHSEFARGSRQQRIDPIIGKDEDDQCDDMRM